MKKQAIKVLASTLVVAAIVGTSPVQAAIPYELSNQVSSSYNKAQAYIATMTEQEKADFKVELTEWFPYTRAVKVGWSFMETQEKFGWNSDAWNFRYVSGQQTGLITYGRDISVTLPFAVQSPTATPLKPVDADSNKYKDSIYNFRWRNLESKIYGAGTAEYKFYPSEKVTVAEALRSINKALDQSECQQLMKHSRSEVESWGLSKTHKSWLSVHNVASRMNESTVKKLISKAAKEDAIILKEDLAQTIYELTDGKLPQNVAVWDKVKDKDVIKNKDAVKYCLQAGLMSLNSVGKFNPNYSIQRDEFADVVVKMDNKVRALYEVEAYSISPVYY